MNKNEIIKEIIRLQSEKRKIFYKVADEKELNKLSIKDLNHIHFISKMINN